MLVHTRYVFVHLDEKSPGHEDFDPKDARWNKVKILEQALDKTTGWARHLDYVMWVDADMIFLDMVRRYICP